MTRSLGQPSSRSLLARIIDTPDVVQTIRALEPPAFAALVRHIGVEDAGEIVALATTDQLVTAFDEDLFVNAKPGERETFDSTRFTVWLEVLLEAGDDVAANRIADLSEEFVVQALSSLVIVLDHDVLLARMSEGGDDTYLADKALESCLSEEIDGYLLISRGRGEGWDAALALVLALDRERRDFLVRILDRCAEVASGYLDDLAEFAAVLSAADSLAEDVEAEREERRSRRGYVEPRAARSFLELARTPLATGAAGAERDPVSRAYFRDLPRERPPVRPESGRADNTRLLRAIGDVAPPPLALLPSGVESERASGQDLPLVVAMRLLEEREPEAFSGRMEELAYLANVLVSGAVKGAMRFQAADAAEAVLATVSLGIMLEAGAPEGARVSPPSAEDLFDVLRVSRADVLFRRAVSTLLAEQLAAHPDGFLCSRAELEAVARLLLSS